MNAIVMIIYIRGGPRMSPEDIGLSASNPSSDIAVSTLILA